MKSIFVYTIIISFALGIAWQDIFELNTAFAVFLLVLGFTILLIAKTTRQDIAVKYFTVIVIGIFTFTLGTVRMGLVQDATSSIAHIYDAQLGVQVELMGIIIDEPDVREYTTNLVVEVLSLDNVRNVGVGPLQILVKARPHQTFAYGDKVSLSGTLEKPKNVTGDTGREFDYIGYLAKGGVHYLIKYPSIEVVSSDNGSRAKATLFGIKGRYIDVFSEMIPEPQAGLAAGITVGAKRALGSELMEAFRNTGLIHIVVLSGFNVTIIIIFLLRAFAWFPRWAGWSLASLAVVLFAILTGADAPVVRASAMGLLGVAALTLGRTYAITRALMLVALAMVVWNPQILLHDIAFQLSVVATLGLIFFAPPITQRLELRVFKSPKLHWLAEIVGVTVAAQLAVLPLLIWYMGEVSVVAVIVNVLALPVIPLAMLLTFVTGLIGMVSTSLALPFAYATYGLLAYIVQLVEFFNTLPMTTLQIF